MLTSPKEITYLDDVFVEGTSTHVRPAETVDVKKSERYCYCRS